MRVLPILRQYNTNKSKNNTSNTQFEKNEQKLLNVNHSHRYTGNVARDLALASMFDNKIARDLKLMGLI